MSKNRTISCLITVYLLSPLLPLQFLEKLNLTDKNLQILKEPLVKDFTEGEYDEFNLGSNLQTPHYDLIYPGVISFGVAGSQNIYTSISQIDANFADLRDNGDIKGPVFAF